MNTNEFLTTVETDQANYLTHLFEVTQAVYTRFQECSGDMNPLHTDEAFARNKGFRERVMYGNILNAFVSYYIGECLPTEDVLIHAQDIAYKKPVYLHDKLLFEARIDGVYDSVQVVEFSFKFTNQNKQVVAKGHIQIGLLQ